MLIGSCISCASCTALCANSEHPLLLSPVLLPPLLPSLAFVTRYLGGEASADWTSVLDAQGGTNNFYTDLGLIKGSDMEVVVPTTGGW